LRPLFLCDEFVVETRVLKVGAASISVEQKFVKNDEICAILTGTAAYLDANGRPACLPDVLADALKK
jgi:acyl-CoA thioesterase FadM